MQSMLSSYKIYIAFFFVFVFVVVRVKLTEIHVGGKIDGVSS